jgi:hypothetical protein
MSRELGCYVKLFSTVVAWDSPTRPLMRTQPGMLRSCFEYGAYGMFFQVGTPFPRLTITHWLNRFIRLETFGRFWSGSGPLT